ncbi:MAG: spondin domain-containing protein, partial [Marinirhabdus sp.]
MKKFFLGLLSLSLLFVACDDNDEFPTNGEKNLLITIENIVVPQPYYESGAVAVPDGQKDPAPIFPGQAYEFTVNAGPHILPGDAGTRLSFVTMFVQSNDLFLAPNGEGINLYDEDGNPVEGNVTDQVFLWDAGTEVNEETGGPNQKPQQDPNASDQGVDENGVVTLIQDNTDGVNILPDVNEVIRVTLTHQNETEFVVRIQNVSTNGTIIIGAGTGPVPMSPLVYVVHTETNPLFTVGEAASEGLEDIAEDGFPMVETDRIVSHTGMTIPLSPGVWAVHDDSVKPLFETGNPDLGEGLEAIAEDGAPEDLAVALAAKAGVSASALFNTPDGSLTPGPIGPGGTYSFEVTANPGDYLSFATMMVQSNDWIYAFEDTGLPLFDGNEVVTGDVSASLKMYDVGTEIDQYPGAGADQVIRQAAPNTGAADPDNTVRGIIPSG